MRGFDSRDQLPEFPSCPSFIEEPTISRRRLIQGAGLAAAGLAIGAGGIVKEIERLDTVLSKELWPKDRMGIQFAHGSEYIRPTGHLNLFFGGFGQKSVDTDGYFDATGRKDLTGSIVFPNDRFTIEDVADYTDKVLVEHDIRSVTVIGPSMGFPIGIKTFGILAHRRAAQAGLGANATAAGIRSTLPSLDKLIAFSSPADRLDAYRGDVVHAIAQVARIADKPPQLVLMWLYSYLDGPGDPRRGTDIRNLRQLDEHFKLTWDQVIHGTSVDMAISQLIILDDFNAEQDCRSLTPMVTPGITEALFTEPTNKDDTVNNSTSISTYNSTFNKLGVRFTVLSTGPVGHAKVPESTEALRRYYASTGAVDGRAVYNA